MTRLGLTLNEAKTSIKQARRERFDFLGYTFGPHRFRKDGHWYLGASPSKKSVARLRRKVDRKSTRLNSSHGYISYAVFCLKKKKKYEFLTQLFQSAVPTDATSWSP